MPEMRLPAEITPDIYQWLGRASALVEATGASADAAQLSVCALELSLNFGDGRRGQAAAFARGAVGRI
jgi:hypothetical protein